MNLLQWIIGLIRSLFGTVEYPVDNQNPYSRSNESPAKYALLVGINKYMIPDADLRGCVNDVRNMWDLLTRHYDFNPDNIRVLTDFRATKQNILLRLQWLSEVVNKGDMVVFHYSGHGSQLRDRSGDELEDHLDEILAPTDMDWDDPLTDDILSAYFKKITRKGAMITFLCDSCHSGTMSRGIEGKDVKIRYMPPPFDIEARSLYRNISISKLGQKGLRQVSNDVTRLEDQKHMLLSGCRDDQTSADAYIEGKYQGAMTSHFIKALKDDMSVDWVNVHKKMNMDLMISGFSQVPQLSGPSKMLDEKPFNEIKETK